jgi:hypothetical protein
LPCTFPFGGAGAIIAKTARFANSFAAPPGSRRPATVVNKKSEIVTRKDLCAARKSVTISRKAGTRRASLPPCYIRLPACVVLSVGSEREAGTEKGEAEDLSLE